MLPPTPETPLQYPTTAHFGRLKRFDPESLNFSIRKSRLTLWRSLTARVRTHVSHRVWWQGNQGPTSQCGAYSLLTAFEAMNHPRGAGKPLYGYFRPIMKPFQIYNRAQELDEWPGSESVDPKYEGTSGTAAAKAAQEYGLIDGYDWEFNDIEVCARAIFTAPLVFGIDWKEGMMLDGAPRMKWHDAIVKPTGGTVGGHLICAVGYDKRRVGAEWHLMNSWGRSWGYDGGCFISKDDLGALLADQGECVMNRQRDDKLIAAAMKARKV